MRVNEIKDKLDFYADAMFQSGYDMGWNSVLEELEQMSDREWNQGVPFRAEALRWAINKLREVTDEIAEG